MTNYPNKLDDNSTIPAVDNNATEITADVFNAVRDALLSVERTLGITPQGSTADLATRVNAALNLDGSIKTSALSGKGLVTLPITNAQIAAGASIPESKLDLDYSTASLNVAVSSLDSLVNASIANETNQAANFNSHVNGTNYSHNSSAVVVSPAVRGQTNVKDALNAISTQITTDESSNTELIADLNSDIAAANTASTQKVAAHVTESHATGIIESAQRNTTLAATIYQTNYTADNTPNIIQVMRPNVARIVGGPIDFGGIIANSTNTLVIQAGGLGLGPLTVTLTIPVYSVEGLVATINTAARDSHYPIAAYAVGGKLVLAHNIPGSNYTILVSGSACGVLGLSSVTVSAPSDCGAMLAGSLVSDFGVVCNQSGISAIPTSPALPVGSLCNVTNHQTSSANGTYYITEAGTLNATLPSGTFNLEVVKNSAAFGQTSDGQVYDVFVDFDSTGLGKVSTAIRLDYQAISGLSIVSVNEYFPVVAVVWGVDGSGSLTISEAGNKGPATIIPADLSSPFIGRLQVASYNGLGIADVEVTGSVATGTVGQTVTSYAFAGTTSRLYVCSVLLGGNLGTYALGFLTDKRQLGTTSTNDTYDSFNQGAVEQVINDLYNNGVVSGLEYLSNTASTISFSGGVAYVAGRRLEVPAQTITLISADFAAASGMVLLNRYGNLIIKSGSQSGFSYAGLQSDGYGDSVGCATILEYGTTQTPSLAFSGAFTDRRLIIANLGKQLSQFSNDYVTNTQMHNYVATLNVKDYGAVGDGITDDTAAFQRAIDFVTAQGQGEITVPAGSSYYKICGTLILNNGVHIVGVGGINLANYTNTSRLVHAPTIPGAHLFIAADPGVEPLIEGCLMENLVLVGADDSGDGLHLVNIGMSHFRNLSITGFNNSIYLDSFQEVSLEDCMCLASKVSSMYFGPSGDNTTGHVLRCLMQDGLGWGAILSGSNLNHFFVDTVIESNVIGAMDIGRGSSATLLNCWLENNPSVAFPTGAASSGSTTSLVDASRVESTTDYWVGFWVIMKTGTNAGHARRCTGFNPSTHTLTVAAFSGPISPGDTYKIVTGAIRVGVVGSTDPSIRSAIQIIGGTLSGRNAEPVDADAIFLDLDNVYMAQVNGADLQRFGHLFCTDSINTQNLTLWGLSSGEISVEPGVDTGDLGIADLSRILGQFPNNRSGVTNLPKATINGSIIDLYDSTGSNTSWRISADYVYTAPDLTAEVNSELAFRADANKNFLIGGMTHADSTARGVLGLANATAPAAGIADTLQVYSYDMSPGNTVLGVQTEGTGIVGSTTPTANRTVAIIINGALYYLLASTIP